MTRNIKVLVAIEG